MNRASLLQIIILSFTLFANWSCTNPDVVWEAASTSLSLSYQSLSPSVGVTSTYQIKGGVPPFSVSIAGQGSFTLSGERSILFDRPWMAGSSRIDVTDFIGAKTTAILSLNGGALQFGGGGAPVSTPLQQLTDTSGNLYLTGTTQALMPGTQFGTPGNQSAYIIKVKSSGKVDWISQIGAGAGSLTISAKSLIDSTGNIYIFGSTDGMLGGTQSGIHGILDSFVAKFSANGSLIWVHQLGAGIGTTANPVQILLDSTNNVFISGTTNGFTGGTQIGTQGLTDSFVTKFSSAGVLQWSRQIGGGGVTTTQNLNLKINSASGNIFIFGTTEGTLGGTQAGLHGASDSYVLNLSAAGLFVWVFQIGGGGISATVPGSFFLDIGGNVYISGTTNGSLGGTQSGTRGAQDLWISQTTPAGTLGWAHQLGGGGITSTQHVTAVQDASANTYLLGTTDANLTPISTQFGTHGDIDYVLEKITSAGALSWVNQMGGGFSTTPTHLNLTGTSVTVAGYLSGNIGGLQIGTAGNQDVFISQFSSAGTHAWTRQMGGGDVSTSTPSFLLVDSGNNAFVAGSTSGLIGGTLAGGRGITDAFTIKLNASGNSIWKLQLGGGGTSETFCSQISQDADNNTFMMGRSKRLLIGSLIGPNNFENSYFAKISSLGQLQ